MTNSARISRRRLLVAGVTALATARTQTGMALAQEGNSMRLRFIFADQDFTATLEDNPSAWDFFSVLPLRDLEIDNYANNEKIAYLPRKLTEEGSRPFENERPGDLCYYAPWGNLAMFYGPYRWSRGLIRLGRFDQGPTPLLVRGKFPLRIEIIE